MPEPTEDIQDIGQMVAQADALVAELEAATAEVLQSASEEGPIIESPEWVPPTEPEPEAEPQVETEAKDPSNEQASEEQVGETASDSIDRDDETPTEDQPAESDEPEMSAASTPTPEAPVAAATDKPQEPEEAQAATATEDEPETTTDSAEPQAEAPTADVLPEPGEGGAVRVLDALDEAPDPPPEPTADEHDEEICEVESEESEHEPASNILMDEEPPAPTGAPELLADAPGGSSSDRDDASERVRSLDDELARLADEMIEGEHEDDGVLLADAEEAPADVSEETAASETSDPHEPNEQPAPVAAVETVYESPDQREPKPECPKELKQRVVFYSKIAASQSVKVAREKGPVIAARVEPIAKQACEVVSKPLEKKKPIVRQAIGWVAISTAMYASAVLFYVAFMRKPPVIEPDEPGTTLIDQSGRSIASHPDDQ